MRILFYDTKSYDQNSFDATCEAFPNVEIEYTKSDLDPRNRHFGRRF